MSRALIAAIIIVSALFGSIAQAQGSCGTGGAGGTIVLDGNFSDWAGQACVPDPPGDCNQSARDLTAVWFADNPDDPNVYFMVERLQGAATPIAIQLNIDINNNGVYGEPGDRVLAIRYQARNSDSRVDVELWDGTGALLATLATNADLGESRNEGARRVEFGAPFAQLGITAGQAIRFRATAQTGGTNSPPCDQAAEVQWSPANALGLLLIGVVVGAAIVLARRHQEAKR